MNKLAFINKLLYFCLEQKERGHDFSFYYHPHVNEITISGNVGGWRADTMPGLSVSINIEDLTQRKVNSIIGASLKLIGETPLAQAA